MIVAKIYVGHKIIVGAKEFAVIGNMKSRSGYKYICLDDSGKKVSLDREDVLQAQRDGEATVSL